MRILMWATVFVLVAAMAAPAFSQGNRRWPPRGDDRRGDDWRGGDDRRGDAPGRGQGNDWGDPGWGESGTEKRVVPGEIVKDADKNTRLEAEADKLALEDKKIRSEFVKLAKIAWQKSEREDRRYHTAWKRAKDNEEALTKEKEKHKEELAEIWKECDDKLTSGEVLSSDLLEKFQTNTADLRTETATDRSHAQDVIRERKLKGIRERMEEYRKRNQGGAQGGNEEKEKKEKKEEEED